MAVAIGAFQLVGSFGAAGNQPDRKGMDAVAVALVLLGPLALAVRDRWPVVAVAVAMGAADVFIGLGYPFGPIFVSIVVAIVGAVMAGRARATWLTAVVGYAGFVVAEVVDPKHVGDIAWLHLLVVAGFLAAVPAIAELVRTRREQLAERQRTAEEDQRRRAGEQRLRIAQELHDVLAHDISLINVQAGVALHLVDEQPEQARTALANIKEASRDALHELRSALDLLRAGDDAPRAPTPRLDDLDALVAAVRGGGLDIRLDRAELPPLPTAVELAAFRIVQEALTNVTRHAHARTATVRLGLDDDALVVEVADDGLGGTAVPGNGITGMRERATALGGTLEAGPRPGGFAVTARIPIS
ncbi:MAG: histidine kinase [Actinomycetia bacterium]|nr:histidine kinase [Actinomycetes bacterium]